MKPNFLVMLAVTTMALSAISGLNQVVAAPLERGLHSQTLAQGLPGDQSGQPSFEQMGITLSDDQKTQLKEANEQTQTKVESILTADQLQTLKNSTNQGGDPSSALSSLNLTSSQKRSLRKVMQEQRKKIDSILTAEQKQQLQAKMQSRGR